MTDIVIYNMSTTWRHNRIIADIRAEIYHQYREKVRNQTIRLADEEIALVYEGNIEEEFLWLVEIETLQNPAHFAESTIDALRWVQPDFFMFSQGNPCIQNKNGTRVAGRPNLIVEVWSESNPQLERERKFVLYSSSPVTEHWYIEQDNNVVECYCGKNKLYEQSLEKALKTREGISIDLTHLSLK